MAFMNDVFEDLERDASTNGSLAVTRYFACSSDVYEQRAAGVEFSISSVAEMFAKDQEKTKDACVFLAGVFEYLTTRLLENAVKSSEKREATAVSVTCGILQNYGMAVFFEPYVFSGR